MIQEDIAALRQVVQQAIDKDRVGRPQFLRCMARAADAGQLEAALGELASLADGWFGSSSVRQYRLGEGSGVYLTEMRKWPQGQGALLTISTGSHNGSPDLDLMLLGSRGTLYHEA